MSETKPLIQSDHDAEMFKKLKAYQPFAFFVTFGGYFMSHVTRKSYSTVKQQLQSEAGYSAALLSAMDSVFMLTYGVSNMVNGRLGDMFNPTTILAIGLWGSGVTLLLMVAAILLDLVSINRTMASAVILFLYFIFGFFQATGGPVGTAVMGNWYCDADSVKNRGTIFGFWTCHQYMGDICAALITAWILGSGAAYWWALVVPAILNILWAFVTIQLVADPYDMGIITPEVKIRQAKFEAKKREMAEQGKSIEADTGPQAIAFMDAFKIPMVANYAIAFGFFKLTNYVLFFWLPYFLGKNFDPVKANLIASLYSVGMMPGGIIVGIVSDFFGGRRALVIGVFMGFLIVLLAVFAKLSESDNMDPTTLLVMLACMGILVGGPNNIITSAVAADLSSHPSVRGSSKSLGTVTGIINGCGGFIAGLGLLAVGPLQARFGWSSVWIYLIGCTATGTGLMGTKIYSEIFPSSQTLTADV
ncbi:MFS general substrate transporter [Fragilariopsis cylindrus CCMP1102]|uniref:MFS general substrate transporter n=1 Tax=Fragilariopsis cylindrus CCMP1102 TaxID=635003 RepID=A0A1E7FBP3_9STRA|nr:MFS general substrate transporter [Fragilariopsis cylindrus CCMP1102]|eukprot:OEU15588.1 MFS general substrate transporter [Fragilariopsis cylindrus CCMP1102]